MPTQTPSSWKAHLGWYPVLAWLAVVVAVYLGFARVAFEVGAPLYVSVPEVDQYTLPIAKVAGKHTDAEVKAILGEPAAVTTDTYVFDWRYYVRVTSDAVQRPVPAPMLEIALDSADRVADWGFTIP